MNELLEPFERLLADCFTPAQVRLAEAGGATDAMWSAIADSGFLDALVPEPQGGAGLTLAEVQPLWQALGYYAAPVPVGETMIARYLMAMADATIVDGPVALSSGAQGHPVPYALTGQHILRESDGILWLKNGGYIATGVRGSLAGVRDEAGEPPRQIGPAPISGLRAFAAILRASMMAGAAARLTEMTASYAKERVQFGKPIGRQQALQQNMAMMAEDMVASRIAAQIGCAGSMPPSVTAAATAKSITSRAASRIAATAHAVHGAIGISEEHDLQLYTRRLHEWRLADGSESYWNKLLGEQRLALPIGSVDFVRKQLPLQ